MVDLTDLYLDHIKTDTLEHLDPAICEIIFSKAEFFARSRRKAHSCVHSCLKEVYDSDVCEYAYLYAPANIVRERLAIQGYTAARMEALWEEARTRHIQTLERLLEQISSERLSSFLKTISEISYASWKCALQTNALARFTGDQEEYDDGDLEGIFREEPLWDTFATLAIRLDALTPTAAWVDLTNLYAEYGFDTKLTPHENFAAEQAPYEEPIGKIVILTEGKTDQRIISAAMNALYPEYADAYQFIDFEAFRIEGGASPLARMVKAFAGVHLKSRMLAIFDNDAAGAEALMTLRAIKLPVHIATMSLPDLELAKRYPTEGPEGLRVMDVNGRACAIEMFCGRPCLMGGNGKLRPVRWSQWNNGAARYQGELVGKAEITETFLNSMNGSPSALRRKFPEMCRLLQAIFGAFKK